MSKLSIVLKNLPFPGLKPTILVSPYLNEIFPRLFERLDLEPVWAKEIGEVARLARKSPPDAALEWMGFNEDQTPVKDVVDLLGLDCPVLLCGNRGFEFQEKMMRLGYHGTVRFPEGSLTELRAEIVLEIGAYQQIHAVPAGSELQTWN